MSVLIGICGGSGSGKSTLAAAVAARLGTKRAGLLPFDTYYRDHGHLTPQERAAVNYDHPDSLDRELFIEHLDLLARGVDVATPVYDFATHTRSSDTLELVATEFIVVEGILLFSFPEITDRLALRIFRDCPERTRFRRRVRRDVAERGRTPESVAAQFEATVKPMHDRYVQPSMDIADKVVPGDGDLDRAAEQVTEDVLGLVALP